MESLRQIAVRPHPDAEPVFIVGCWRSGTTALRTALQQGAGFRGFNEGNLAPLLGRLHATIDGYLKEFPPHYLAYSGNMVGVVGTDSLKAAVTNALSDLILQTMGCGRWCDKSPMGSEMVLLCPLLLEPFPRARFVFCKRRGIENILSARRKFSDFDFVSACHVWARTMRAWQHVRARLGECGLEVDQRDMALCPQQTAQTLRAFLGLSESETQGVAASLCRRGVEQTRAAQDERYLSLQETGWSTEERARFESICRPMMEAFGYSLQASAPTGPSPLKLFVPHPESARSIERRHVPEEGGFTRDDRGRLLLRPNPRRGERAEVRYLCIRLCGHSRFSAQISVIGARTPAVRFGFRIECPAERRVVAASNHSVQDSGVVGWRVDFPPLEGTYDLVIAAEIVEDVPASALCQACWEDARLD